jgi:hypothetical protein
MGYVPSIYQPLFDLFNNIMVRNGNYGAPCEIFFQAAENSTIRG